MLIGPITGAIWANYGCYLAQIEIVGISETVYIVILCLERGFVYINAKAM